MQDACLVLTLVAEAGIAIRYGAIRLIGEPANIPPGTARTARNTMIADALLLGDGRHLGSARTTLRSARRTYTTQSAASALRGNAVGLAPFETCSIGCDVGQPMWVTATPVHDDACALERDAIGFTLGVDKPGDLLYVMGGRASWHDGIAEVADRFAPKAVLLFSTQAGADGPVRLPLPQDDAVRVANAFPRSMLVAIRDRAAASPRPCREPLALALSKIGGGGRLKFFTKGRPLSIA